MVFPTLGKRNIQIFMYRRQHGCPRFPIVKSVIVKSFENKWQNYLRRYGMLKICSVTKLTFHFIKLVQTFSVTKLTSIFKNY